MPNVAAVRSPQVSGLQGLVANARYFLTQRTYASAICAEAVLWPTGTVLMNDGTGNLQSVTLPAVAISGSYNDLADQPTLTTGPQGAKGDTGATGSTGLSGATGATGTTGATGAAGSNGTNGAAATVAVGTVTGLAAGATPTVTNTGTSSAAVFAFGIPAGAIGSTGSTGATGTTGAAGAQGIQGTTGATGAQGSSATVAVNAPLTNGGTSTAANLSITQATSSVSGFLSAADWATFNAKQSAFTIGAGLQLVSGALSGVLATVSAQGDMSASDKAKLDSLSLIGGFPVESITTVSANYAVTTADEVIRVTAAATITLPTAVGIAGKRFRVKSLINGTVVIATTSSQTIDGQTTQKITSQYGTFNIMSNGTNFDIV